jgi:predicted NBD/HSP70 family sugar kinase
MNGPQVMTSPLFLGIDTGGTYTDAVLYSESEGVLASAKSLTTRHDLAIGVSGAVETVLQKSAPRSGGSGWFRSPPRSPPTRLSRARADAPGL